MTPIAHTSTNYGFVEIYSRNSNIIINARSRKSLFIEIFVLFPSIDRSHSSHFFVELMNCLWKAVKTEKLLTTFRFRSPSSRVSISLCFMMVERALCVK